MIQTMTEYRAVDRIPEWRRGRLWLLYAAAALLPAEPHPAKRAGSRRRPCLPSPSAAQKRQRHPAPCPSWRCGWQEPHRSGTSCHRLHQTSTQLSISPDCPPVSNRPCQGSGRTVPDSCCGKGHLPPCR